MESSVTPNFPFPLARQIRGLSGTANEDLSTWPTLFEPALGESLPTFLKRKHAIVDYLCGTTDAVLRQRHGLSLKAVYRLIVNRCLRVHRDGLIYGWRGLVRYSHLAPYTRSKPIHVDGAGKGAAGAISVLFALEPELREQFNKQILKPASDDKLEEKRNRTSHWKWLLAKLRKKGYEIRHEWPFNTQSMGYVSVCRYVNSILAANPSKGAAVLAETSNHVRQTLYDLVGSRLLDPKTSFSVRRSMDDRPFIETFFRHLGKEGFQRLTNTTGGDPKGMFVQN